MYNHFELTFSFVWCSNIQAIPLHISVIIMICITHDILVLPEMHDVLCYGITQYDK